MTREHSPVAGSLYRELTVQRRDTVTGRVYQKCEPVCFRSVWASPVNTSCIGIHGRDTARRRPAGRRASNGRESVAAQTTADESRHTATTNWLTRDTLGEDSLGRQILVVGDGIPGTLVTGVLSRAGFDPVLVTDSGAGLDSRLTYLWPAALRLLEPVGIESSLRASGTPVEAVACGGSEARADSQTVDSQSAPSPLVVPSDTLLNELQTVLLEDTVVQHRTIDTLEQAGDALEVTFEDGVREWFDIVVVTSPGGVDHTDDSHRREPPTVTQFEAPIGSASLKGTHVWGSWQRDGLVELLPSPDSSTRLLRLTTAGPDPAETLRSVDWAGTSVSVESAVAQLAETAQTTVRQVSAGTSVTPGWWGTGRVPRCGSAGFPTAPASGVHVAMAIEDAWVLVEQLVRGPESVPRAVETYARRRSRRIGALSRRERPDCPGEGPPPGTLSTPLSTVRRLRTAALSPVCHPEGTPDGAVDGS
jgi:2-polyprenyl-6-methoxyphenol hydroxylase-like FAD-dependent oxidoreductase